MYLGLAAYFSEPVWTDADRVRRVASLFVDRRWPWIPWWASASGVHPRDDRSMQRVGGKNGIEPIVEIMNSPRCSTLYLDRALGDNNFSNVCLNLGRMDATYRVAPYQLWIRLRCHDLPDGKSIIRWLELAHELVVAVRALNATIGVWPTSSMALSDTWLTRVVLDHSKGEIDLGLPANFDEQTDLLTRNRVTLGGAHARHPRWGTYLKREHVDAIGGIDRIRAEVEPARIDQLATLTYIQLTDSVETALTPAAGEKRRVLEALMTPILVGAPIAE